MSFKRVSLIFFLVFIVLAFVYYLRPQPITDVFDSPDGRYRVEFSGEKDRPVIPFDTSIVMAEIFDRGASIGQTEIHYADWMDTSFYLTYQTFRWHQADVFGLHGVNDKDPSTAETGDALTISNQSSSKLHFVNARFDVNRFLILGLEPHTSRTMFIHHSMAPTWITASAIRNDGATLKSAGVNFFESEKRKGDGPFKYCITIDDDSLEINSVDLIGNEHYLGPNIPKTSSCNG
jgi:hypothetical protein